MDDLQSKRNRVESLSLEFERVRNEIDERPLPRPDEEHDVTEAERQLFDRFHQISQQLEHAQADLGAAEIRAALTKSRKNETLASTIRYIFLTAGIALLATLAYVFRQNVMLAGIPLLGLVALMILWPVYEKFRQLQRVEAEFTTKGINVAAAANETDEYLRLQGEVAKKRAQLQIESLNRQIAQLRSGEKVSIKADEEKTPEGPWLLSSPGSESETKS